MGDFKGNKNHEGYSDPTAYKALKKIDETERFNKMLRAIFDICDAAGYEVQGRIVFVDKVSGRIWR